MSELYQCANDGCEEKFTIKRGEKYQDDPALRKCKVCGKKGVRFLRSLNIQYGMIVRDELGGDIMCPADGKHYSSKAAYYKAVKAKGLEIVGNDKMPVSKPKTEEIDWKRAVKETLDKSGYKTKRGKRK